MVRVRQGLKDHEAALVLTPSSFQGEDLPSLQKRAGGAGQVSPSLRMP